MYFNIQNNVGIELNQGRDFPILLYPFLYFFFYNGHELHKHMDNTFKTAAFVKQYQFLGDCWLNIISFMVPSTVCKASLL